MSREIYVRLGSRAATRTLGSVVAAVALLACAGWQVQAAQADAVHPFLEAASLDGANAPAGEFSKACGVAVDSAGDVYVANSGKSAIDVFASDGTYLTSIADTKQPCGLAVDSKGVVYAVDTMTKNVVRYTPLGGAFPPTPDLAYSSASTLDASGEASAVAVNLEDNIIYVANPDHIDAYTAAGGVRLGNEIQEVLIQGDGGTFTLAFEGASTAALPAEASAAEVQAALEAVPAIGAGNVQIAAEMKVEGSGAHIAKYEVTFINGRGDAALPQIEADITNLTATVQGANRIIRTLRSGWHGAIGTFTDAYGVGVWGANGTIYVASESGLIYIFDPTGTKVLRTINGSGRPGGPYAALPEASIAVNQSNGHVLVSDVGQSGAVDEFEATGVFVTQLTHSFANAEPSAVAVDPSENVTAGSVYVTSGSESGSHVYAFGPLPTPTHPELPSLAPDAAETPAERFQDSCGVAIDSQGDVYVASMETSAIDIFKPEGSGLKYLTTITDVNRPCSVAVDSAGNVFVTHPLTQSPADHPVLAYSPSSYPFSGVPVYAAPKAIGPANGVEDTAVTVNPVNQHILIARRGQGIFEYSSLATGANLERGGMGDGLSDIYGLAVYGRTGEIYVQDASGGPSNSRPGVHVLNPIGTEILAEINGGHGVSKKPDGELTSGFLFGAIAVDQSNGHVYFGLNGEDKWDVYEFEGSGAYASRLDRPAHSEALPGIAVDNSGGPRDGDVYVAGGTFNPNPNVRVFAPPIYGAPPSPSTAPVVEADGTTTTLPGSVDPEGVELEACGFEYVNDVSFQSTGFATAAVQPCDQSSEAIGSGSTTVPVTAHVIGLNPMARYHYRLVARNQFGQGVGEGLVFGPPRVSGQAAGEALFTEADLAATVDPAGLVTQYYVEYGQSASYGSLSQKQTVEGQGPQSVKVGLFGLASAATYHFRFVASNGIETVAGPDETFTTLIESSAGSCPNASLRTGASASLPDCRAYELVSPPDANGLLLEDLREPGNVTGEFVAPMVSPDGNDAMFYSGGTLPGANGNGRLDAYRSHRGADGWAVEIASPTGVQAVAPAAGGVTPAHDYAFWSSGHEGGTLQPAGVQGNYLRQPDGTYQLIGIGSIGTDPSARGRWISEGGSHVIFTSKVPLTGNAPPAGTEAVYDRTATGVAHLVSVLSDGSVPLSGEDANYLGASADGSTVAFSVGSKLYLYREGESFEVASGNVAFGGLSSDGTKLFYVQLIGPPHAAQVVDRGEIERFDTNTGQSQPVGSGGESVLVNVPSDGSRAYFASREVLVADEGVLGSENLYSWDESGVSYIGTLADTDIEGASAQAQGLGNWVQNLDPSEPNLFGPGANSSRANADGKVFAFESSANLTDYDAEDHTELYRYSEGQLDCVSCLAGAPAGPAPLLQSVRSHDIPNGPVLSATQISNVSSEGAVFFETAAGLVPRDQNAAQDVYEWRNGVVSLLSSGKGASSSYLYAASPDGHDVLIITAETLLSTDIDNGSPSIYDARIDGGFPDKVSPPCQGDACRQELTEPPQLSGPSTESLGAPEFASNPASRCPQGKRAVERKGKHRCVPKTRKRAAKHARRHHRGQEGNR